MTLAIFIVIEYNILDNMNIKEKYKCYSTWASIKTRCNNSNSSRYEYYGSRGIKVCKRWNIFKNFLEDMGEKPNGLEIDRIDNEGNYEPNNCRWTTRSINNKNRRFDINNKLKIKRKRKKIEKIKKLEKHRIINLIDEKQFNNQTKASEYYNISHQAISFFIKKDKNSFKITKRKKYLFKYLHNL